MDLNQALKPLLAEGNLEKLQELVSFNLRPETILTELEQSKKFDMLPAFLPLLNLERNKSYCEDLACIYAKCLLVEDKESVDALDKHLGNHLESRDIAFHYGRLTQDDLLVDWAKENYLNFVEYLDGIVSSDDVNLFEEVSLRWDNRNLQLLINTRFLRTAGRFCAVEMMEYFGYEKWKVGEYLTGAYLNLTTVEFLSKQEIPFLDELLKKRIQELTFFNWDAGNAPIAAFIRACLQKGWLVFSDQEWNDLASSSGHIYKQLQSDV